MTSQLCCPVCFSCVLIVYRDGIQLYRGIWLFTLTTKQLCMKPKWTVGVQTFAYWPLWVYRLCSISEDVFDVCLLCLIQLKTPMEEFCLTWGLQNKSSFSPASLCTMVIWKCSICMPNVWGRESGGTRGFFLFVGSNMEQEEVMER